MKRFTSFAVILTLGVMLTAAWAEIPKSEKQMARTEINQVQVENIADVNISNNLLASEFRSEYVSEATQEIILPYADVIKVGDISKGFGWLPVKPPVL